MPRYRFLHWNIKELDAEAIASCNPAYKAATELMRSQKPDFLSINELEFGSEPHSKNFQKLLHDTVPEADHWHETFVAANSGQRAKPGPDGKYLRFHEKLSPSEREMYLDQANFGLFPGQFSIALGTRFPICSRQIIRELSWREWDPSAPLADFDLGGMSPETFPLFDKSFQVSWCELSSHPLAIITLHTVPAFDFGQPKSPNVLRNGAQLEFLAWFLTGRHPRGLPPPAGLTPLPQGTSFIAVGDFNIALDSPHLGAKALQHIRDSGLCHRDLSLIPEDRLQGCHPLRVEHTFFSSGWEFKRGTAQLDYFFVSRDLTIHRLETLFWNPEFQDHALLATREEAQAKAAACSTGGREAHVIPFKTAQGVNFYLVRSASENFARLRKASDHLPMLLEFSSLKEE